MPGYDYVQVHGEHFLVTEKLDGGTVWSRFTGSGVTRAGRRTGPRARYRETVATDLAGTHAAVSPRPLNAPVRATLAESPAPPR